MSSTPSQAVSSRPHRVLSSEALTFRSVYTNALLLTLNARTMVRETGKQSTLSYTVPLSGIIARVPGSGTLESSIDTPRMAEVGTKNASASLLEGKTPSLVIGRTTSVPRHAV